MQWSIAAAVKPHVRGFGQTTKTREKNTLLSSVAPVREHLSSSNTKHLCGALRNYLSEYLLSGVVAVAVVESKERSLAHQDPFFFIYYYYCYHYYYCYYYSMSFLP